MDVIVTYTVRVCAAFRAAGARRQRVWTAAAGISERRPPLVERVAGGRELPLRALRPSQLALQVLGRAGALQVGAEESLRRVEVTAREGQPRPLDGELSPGRSPRAPASRSAW